MRGRGRSSALLGGADVVFVHREELAGHVLGHEVLAQVREVVPPVPVQEPLVGALGVLASAVADLVVVVEFVVVDFGGLVVEAEGRRRHLWHRVLGGRIAKRVTRTARALLRLLRLLLAIPRRALTLWCVMRNCLPSVIVSLYQDANFWLPTRGWPKLYNRSRCSSAREIEWRAGASAMGESGDVTARCLGLGAWRLRLMNGIPRFSLSAMAPWTASAAPKECPTTAVLASGWDLRRMSQA
mmetsp:Transcript_1973/g.5860  ORF Transcript_1973/g.5860 Transcript_1973/m.5860 type:complete len:241 (-) Transcript_1973:980-1702(-)